MKQTPILLVVFFLVLFCVPFSATRAVEIDTDADGLSDDQEIGVYHTNASVADNDGDGFLDGEEIQSGHSPHHTGKKLTETDYDGDGLSDALEIEFLTNLGEKDTDADGHDDGTEVYRGFNPREGGNNRALRRHAEVDLNAQKLHYYLDGIRIGSMSVSTGLTKTPTPTGEFKILRKLPVHHYKGPGYDLPNTKWNLEFKRSYYLHGAYWHNQFGIRPMSHGCVNIAYKDVKKLYAFLDVGDKVLIKGVTPRGKIAQK